MSRAETGDVKLVGRQLHYEQLSFWRNPFAAAFTVGFSVIFLILLAATAGSQKISFLDNISEVQYYVPGFAAYGVMSACFNMLAISLVVRRETGLLKRLRLSPLPTWVMVAALFLNALVISVVEVIVLVAVGKLAFGVHLPHNILAFVVALLVGSVCFTALGIGASTIIPNQEAAGPMVSIVFFVLLFLSGLWFPLQSGSVLARISGYFPLRPMINAMFRPFYLVPGSSAWAWHDLLVVAIWGVVGAYVAVRRFKWEPRRTS
ncbi:MAG: ABC transporter permease [Acidimicrobiales bacterium]